MLTLLSIASSIIIIHAANNCPAGTRQIGNDGAFTQYYTQSGQQQRVTADQCKAYCVNMGANNCRSFSFDESSMYGGVPLCQTWRSDIAIGSFSSNPNHPSADQVLCKIDDTVDVACPDGTSQVGGHGSSLNAPSYRNYYGITIDLCKLHCSQNGWCQAFTFDSDNWTEDNSPSLCRLHPYNPSMTTSPIPAWSPNFDQIVCAMSSASAQSEGLFNLDGNGETETVQLSAYIIYFVIGLVLVNIICLGVHCWKKCNKGRSNKYKVVSMRSDQDTDIECQ